jgi:3',5'-cyclic AMP phosphodiesterase CpdA
MFVLAHLSDWHLASRPRLAELAGKRALGFINWQRKRKFIHRPEVLDAITRDLQAQAADHIAVTGDLVNLSLADEYARASARLATLGTPYGVTVVPGNHDVYVRAVKQSPAAYWGDYMRGDHGAGGFPFMRQRADVALIALSSGVPTGPFMATGRVGQQQLLRLADLLYATRGLFRVVLIHHPPMSPLKRYMRRLTDAADLRRVLAAQGAELLLHGHDHRRELVRLEGPGGTTIPAVGVPSASAAAPCGSEDGAGYHLFRIDGEAGAWRCAMTVRQRTSGGAVHEVSRQSL